MQSLIFYAETVPEIDIVVTPAFSPAAAGIVRGVLVAAGDITRLFESETV